MSKILSIFLTFLGCLCLIGGCKNETPKADTQKNSAQGPAAPPNKTITSSSGIAFVLIPAGSFTMGCDKNSADCFKAETPTHPVTISHDFYLGKYEITQAQWLAVMGGNPGRFRGKNNPVENVSWEDAQRFIEKLNKMEKKEYRLPTEAEWEYACRAGSTTTYSFGNEKRQLEQFAWFEKNAGSKTHPVGQLQPNAWGLYDMYGNVWEWCQDWYSDYPAGPQTDPIGPSSGLRRVQRGGSWINIDGHCRSSYRYYFTPGDRDDSLGFRLAMTIVRKT